MKSKTEVVKVTKTSLNENCNYTNRQYLKKHLIKT